MKIFTSIIICLLVSGCSATQSVGSHAWHEQKKQEFSQMYNAGEITRAEYEMLLMEAEQTRSARITRALSASAANNALQANLKSR